MNMKPAIRPLLRLLTFILLLAAIGISTGRSHRPFRVATKRAFGAAGAGITNTDWTKVSQPAPGQIAAGGTTSVESARSFAELLGSLYLGTRKVNQAEVYRYDGGAAWTKISQPTPGQIAPLGTTAIDNVQCMAVLNNILYVGTQEANKAEVYSYDGATWTKVSQPTAGQIAAGGLGSIDRVQTMIVFNGSLYIGTLEANRAEVYRYDGGTTWTRVSKGRGRIAAGGTTGINGIDAMAVLDTNLYVGTAEANRGEVYRYNGGTAWTRVSQPTPGQIAVGGTTNIDIVETMAVHNGSLYAGTHEPGKAEVYRFDSGTTWTKVSQAAGQIAVGGTTAIETAQWLVVYESNLYLGTGKADAGEIYRYDGGTDWTRVSQATPGQIAVADTLNINVAAAGAAVFNSILYVGTDEPFGGEVYSYTIPPP